MRDLVLEGIKPEDIKALEAVARGKRPTLMAALRLRAKGWVDMAGGMYLLTITGRAVLDAS